MAAVGCTGEEGWGVYETAAADARGVMGKNTVIIWVLQREPHSPDPPSDILPADYCRRPISLLPHMASHLPFLDADQCRVAPLSVANL